MRRSISVVLSSVAAGVLALATACSSSGSSGGSGTSAGNSAGKLLTVRLGALESGVNQGILAVALADNDFTKNGLNVEVTAYQSGSLGLDVQDLVSGREDIALDAVVDPITYDSQSLAAGKGTPLKVIAAASPAGADFVIKKSIPFSSVQSLKGLKIGVANLTSSYIPLFQSYLNAHGTSVNALGIKFEVVTAANQVPALASGQIDGFIQSEPTGATAVTDGVGQYVIQDPAAWGAGSIVPITGVFATSTWLSANPVAARDFVKALQEASSAYRSSSAAQEATVLANFTKTSASVMQSAYSHFDPTLTPLESSMQALFKISVPSLIARGVVSSKLTVADVTDTSYGG